MVNRRIHLLQRFKDESLEKWEGRINEFLKGVKGAIIYVMVNQREAYIQYDIE